MFPYENSLVSRVEVFDQDRCQLTFDPDRSCWPWLALPVWHPVVAEKFAYFAAVSAGVAVGTMHENTFTALTGMNWQYHGTRDQEAVPVSALAESLLEAQQAAYSLTAKDSSGAPVFDITGKGVIFRNRDFESWREQRRSASAQTSASGIADGADFTFAAGTAVGCQHDDAVLVGASRPSGKPDHCIARVDQDRGFHPAHPYHTGSGDHVNAAQLLDAAYQASHLLLGKQSKWSPPDRPLFCTAGKARFRNYVELGQQFEIRLTGQETKQSQQQLYFDLIQYATICARITLTFGAG